MATNSPIEWTESTWNPTTGCSRKSDGCKHCYAEILTKRLAAMGNANYQGLLSEHGRFNGVLKLAESNLSKPRQTKKPTVFFTNSMSDLFHENIPATWLDKVFSIMALCPQHTFQILTKRAAGMCDYMLKARANHGKDILTVINGGQEIPTGFVNIPLSNVWLGVSVENIAEKGRIEFLRRTPAKVRFLSCEPLLEDLGELDLTNINWVIVGGESGSQARPMKEDWVKNIRNQCQKVNVPFFFKQWGGVNKKKTGRILEGKTWDEMPT